MDQDVATAIGIATAVIGLTISIALYRFFTIFRNESSLISDQSEV
jgi:hypothetical protein